jgi:phosphoglycerate dehydrogenase-like enzyme
MERYKVVFKGILEPLLREIFIEQAPPNVRVEFIEVGATAEEETARIRDADILVTHKSSAGLSLSQLIEKSEKLRLIQTFSQGVGHIPVSLAAERGVRVCNAGGITAVGVAEHTVLLMLAALKRLSISVSIARQGKPATELTTKYIHRLHDKTVGIIGLGNIGRWVAAVVGGFGARVIFYDVADIPEPIMVELKANRVSLEELLSSADIVTLHVPLLESTRGLLGWKQLTMMKPSAILVNTCRGTVVDESALIRALNEEKIAGAGLDVLTDEPASPDNPLLHRDNVVVTPHIAAEVWEDYLLLIKLTWENVTLLSEGKEPRHIVAPDNS